jgi:hypothetical protein
MQSTKRFDSNLKVIRFLLFSTNSLSLFICVFRSSSAGPGYFEGDFTQETKVMRFSMQRRNPQRVTEKERQNVRQGKVKKSEHPW